MNKREYDKLLKIEEELYFLRIKIVDLIVDYKAKHKDDD